MRIEWITAIIFALIFLLYAFLSRRISTFSDYSVGNRSLPLFLLFASISASFIGPGYSLGFIRKGYESGMLYFVLAGAYGLQTILVGLFVAPRLHDFSNAYSIGDVIGQKHGRWSHILSGLISFGLLIAFSTVMSMVGGTILSEFLGVSQIWGVVTMTSIVIIYSFFGGIKASILTDTFQFLLFIILIPALLIFVWSDVSVSIGQAWDNIKTLTIGASERLTLLSATGLFFSFFLGETLVPPYINRALGAKSQAVSGSAFLFSGLFFFLWLILMLLIGSMGSLSISAEASDKIGLLLGDKHYAPALYGVFIMALVGIVMSSQDSLINSGASVFVRDVVNLHIKLSESQSLHISRLATLLVGIASIVLSVYVPSVLEGLLWCYSLWAPSMLPILLASILLVDPSKRAGVSSIIVGCLLAIWTKISPIDENIATLLGFIGSSITYIIIWRFRPGR
ncbi:MAG: sodium:solute symporter family protein [Saprospiraceae bacterium]|nr:sodium:solute symporter family protein [Saprospiraceae bacterium]